MIWALDPILPPLQFTRLCISVGIGVSCISLGMGCLRRTYFWEHLGVNQVFDDHRHNTIVYSTCMYILPGMDYSIDKGVSKLVCQPISFLHLQCSLDLVFLKTSSSVSSFIWKIPKGLSVLG